MVWLIFTAGCPVNLLVAFYFEINAVKKSSTKPHIRSGVLMNLSISHAQHICIVAKRDFEQLARDQTNCNDFFLVYGNIFILYNM